MLVVASALLLFGCKAKQKAAEVKQMSPEKTIENLVAQSAAADLDFSTINISNAKINLRYGKKEFNVYTSIKIIKDSIISISLMPIRGIELFRVNIMKDKFQVIDKMNRRYAENGYDYFFHSHKMKMGYKMFEDFMTNKSFSISKSMDFSSWQMETMNDTTIITDNSKIMDSFNVRTMLNANHNTIGVALVGEDSEVASIKFSDFDTHKGKQFAKTYDLSTTFPISAGAIIEIKKIEFDEDCRISPLRLSRYERVTIKDIFKFQ